MKFLLKKFKELLNTLEYDHSLPESLSYIIRDMELEFEYQSISFFLRDEANKSKFRIKISRNLSQTFMNKKIIHDNSEILNKIFNSHLTIIQDNELFEMEQEFKHLLLVPITHNKTKFGFIAITFTKNELSVEDKEKAEIFGSIVSFVVENNVKQQMINHNELKNDITKLASLKAFQKMGDRVLRNSLRYNKDITIAVLKIFHYRTLYEKLGKDKVHAILKTIAEIISQDIRNTEILAHIYTDSFAIIFPNSIKKTTMKVINRINQKLYLIDTIKKSHIHWGITEWTPGIKNIMICLDNAISQAEESHRNNFDTM